MFCWCLNCNTKRSLLSVLLKYNLFSFLSFQKLWEQAWFLFFGHKPRKLYLRLKINLLIFLSYFVVVWLGLSMQNASISDFIQISSISGHNRRGHKPRNFWACDMPFYQNQCKKWNEVNHWLHHLNMIMTNRSSPFFGSNS